MRIIWPFILLATVSCQSVPQFPAKFIYEIDAKSGICGQYKVTNYETLRFVHVQDLPIEACQGAFGFSAQEISPVMNWTRDRITDAKKNCR